MLDGAQAAVTVARRRGVHATTGACAAARFTTTFMFAPSARDPPRATPLGGSGSRLRPARLVRVVTGRRALADPRGPLARELREDVEPEGGAERYRDGGDEPAGDLAEPAERVVRAVVCAPAERQLELRNRVDLRRRGRRVAGPLLRLAGHHLLDRLVVEEAVAEREHVGVERDAAEKRDDQDRPLDTPLVPARHPIHQVSVAGDLRRGAGGKIGRQPSARAVQRADL